MRKDEYMRDLISDFIEAKLVFENQYRRFKSGKEIKIEELDYWVGTAENKGPLWGLKDLCHALLDKDETGVSRINYEYAFERAIHLIFHNYMSFKEHLYVIQHFESSLRKAKVKKDENLTRAIMDFRKLMNRIKAEIPEEIETAKELFDIAATLLKLMLPKYKDNILIVEYLLENRKVVEKVYKRGTIKEIFQNIFPQGGEEEAYLLSAKDFMSKGNYGRASRLMKELLNINPHHQEAKALLKKLKQR